MQVFLRWGKILKKYVAYCNLKTRKLEKKIYIKNTYYWCDFFSFVSPSGHFTGHLHFWLQKFKCWIGRKLFTRKNLTVIIFRNFMKSWWWKFEKIVTLFHGNMTLKKCLLYKIRWLMTPISYCASLAFRDTLIGLVNKWQILIPE